MSAPKPSPLRALVAGATLPRACAALVPPAARTYAAPREGSEAS